MAKANITKGKRYNFAVISTKPESLLLWSLNTHYCHVRTECTHLFCQWWPYWQMSDFCKQYDHLTHAPTHTNSNTVIIHRIYAHRMWCRCFSLFIFVFVLPHSQYRRYNQHSDVMAQCERASHSRFCYSNCFAHTFYANKILNSMKFSPNFLFYPWESFSFTW